MNQNTGSCVGPVVGPDAAAPPPEYGCKEATLQNAQHAESILSCTTVTGSEPTRHFRSGRNQEHKKRILMRRSHSRLSVITQSGVVLGANTSLVPAPVEFRAPTFL